MAAPPRRSIGRFQIRRLLGQGAFGAVYLADDPSLDRRVAIKIGKAGALVGRDEVDRFLREARAAAHLRHPNIVPVYEVGQFQGHNYLVYEYIEGQTLAALLRQRGRLAPHQAAEMMRTIAGALGYAHAGGIIHRDMKPENVLLDGAGSPHIADFGLARQDDRRTDTTREGIYLGTPLYMSPEQAGGRSHAADQRSDVWSLGIMLQQMLTGVLPFRGNLTEILVAVQKVEPPSIRSVDASLPKDLETICQKCLAKDPARRYPSAADLAEELDRYLRGEPILARPIGVLARTMRWSQRNPAVASLLGTVGVTLLLGTIVSSYFAIEARRQTALVQKAQHERALLQLSAIKSAVPASVPVLIEALRPLRNEIAPQLRADLKESQLTPRERTRYRLAEISLFPQAAQRLESPEMMEGLLRSRPDEAAMMVEVLRPFHRTVAPCLWDVAGDRSADRRRRFRALAALATLDPQALPWSGHAPDVVAGLLASPATELAVWTTLLHPLRDQLLAELRRQMTTGDEAVRTPAAQSLVLLFADRPATLYEIALRAEGTQLPPLLSAVAGHREPLLPRLRSDIEAMIPARINSTADLRTASNLFKVALVLEPDAVPWSWCGPAPDKQLRTDLIHTVPGSGIAWERLADRLDDEADPVVRIALLQMLAGYRVTELLPGDRERLRDRLLALYCSDADAGVHASTDWLLSRWGFQRGVQAEGEELASQVRTDDRQWHMVPTGECFTVFAGPVEYLMGAADDDPLQAPVERRHRRQIPRTFGIAQHEVTIEDYLRFAADHEFNREVGPEDECPVNEVTWFDAVKYCRWLSEQAGFREEEMCFPPLDQIGPDMKLPEDYLDRPGYRLPTAAEWEYACRAGATTSRPFGPTIAHAGSYVWFIENAGRRTWPVGQRMPNDFGLFDMHGNVMEWCLDWYFDEYPEAAPPAAVIDGADHRAGIYREVRGGAFDSSPNLIRTPDRDYDLPFNKSFVIGFRLARTYSR